HKNPWVQEPQGYNLLQPLLRLQPHWLQPFYCSQDYKNMSEEFEINETHTTFDFKGFLLRLFHHWPLFLISLAIAFSIAYYINVRKLPIYQMENMVSIKDDQNPFFTSNTSLTFNWGGTTDKVNTAVITLQSRSHNEKVVER